MTSRLNTTSLMHWVSALSAHQFFSLHLFVVFLPIYNTNTNGETVAIETTSLPGHSIAPIEMSIPKIHTISGLYKRRIRKKEHIGRHIKTHIGSHTHTTVGECMYIKVHLYRDNFIRMMDYGVACIFHLNAWMCVFFFSSFFTVLMSCPILNAITSSDKTTRYEQRI